MSKESRCWCLICLTVVVLSASVRAQSSVRVWEEDVVMPTYRLEAPDKDPMFYKGESYQGAQKRIYPYPFQEHVTNIREDQPHRFVFLENDYIKLSILPEIGGRLFSAVDKTNDYNIFYQQHVIKPALIGMLGAWISGGIEWCVFHHHRNTTQMPVDYTLVQNPDGSRTVWFGETERRHRMKWMIGITLYPDRSYIEATVKLFNRTPFPHSMLYWANVAVHVNEDYQVIFPPSVQYATYHAKNDFVHWPIAAEFYQGVDYRGVDLSWWKNHPEPVSFFAWDLGEDFMGGYDHGKKAGVAHVGNHHIVAGAKLWEWSPGPRGRLWDKILTDEDGPYAEIMVGAYSDNQPDYSWIKPYEVRTFKQYWFPIREIGGFKRVNLDAAVNLELAEGRARLGFNTTSQQPGARAILKNRGQAVFEQTIDIGPEKPFVREIPLPDGAKETDLHALLLDGSGKPLISYQPVERSYNPELPPTVKPPPDPKQIETVEELYLTGLRLRQIYNPVVDPNAYYEEALRRDPYDTRTNTMVGINLNQRGLYAEAEACFLRAIERLAAAYTRPRDGEAYFHLGLAQRGQGKLEEAVDSLYRAAWDGAFSPAAFYQLAELSLMRGDVESALEQVERSIATNSQNSKALTLKASILRKSGRAEAAVRLLKEVVSRDPLDFLARNEMLLAQRAAGEKEAADQMLQELDRLMRGEVQSYLELATDYGAWGAWEEAIEVLRRPVEAGTAFAKTYPIVFYYLGYYSARNGRPGDAAAYYEKAAQMPPDYAFPFRLESIVVLRSALAARPQDARTYHYLGDLLFEIQPDTAIESWEKARELDPGFAMTHRNLGWAYLRFRNDIAKAILSYEKAVKADNRDPRLFTELDQLYEIGNVAPEKRLALLEENHDVVASMNGSLIREIIVQVLAGHYDRAIGYMDGNFFHIREGGGDLHDVFVDAHLLRGLQYYEKGDYDSALEHFLRAAEYPENLSVGIPRRDARAPQVAVLTAMAYKALGQPEKANEYLERAVAERRLERVPEALYFQGRALAELNRNEEAAQISDQLLADGSRMLEQRTEVDFFAKFGERQTGQARQAMGYYVLGLGHLGKGQTKEARAAMEKSVSLDVSNVWAHYQLARLTAP